jgi:hypothetical protein
MEHPTSIRLNDSETVLVARFGTRPATWAQVGEGKRDETIEDAIIINSIWLITVRYETLSQDMI